MLQRNIVATKMPSVRVALLDLAGTYMEELRRQHIAPPAEADAVVFQQGGCATFTLLHAWATEGIRTRQQTDASHSPEVEADITCLCEIRDKSAALVSMFDTVKKRQGDEALWDNPYRRDQTEALQQPLDLTLPEFMMLRKFWEFGLEEVVMQTFLQMDGDSVTRLHPDYATNDYAILHQVHHRGIQTSVMFWNELIGIVGGIFHSVFSRRA